MINRLSVFMCLVLSLAGFNHTAAETYTPIIYFYFDATNGSGEKKSDCGAETYEDSAPITGEFHTMVYYLDGSGNKVDYGEVGTYSFTGEWRVWKEGGQMESPDLVRRDNPAEIYFTNAELDSIAFIGSVEIDGVETQLDSYYWRSGGARIMTVKTYESVLTFPNAFSPNGDDYNEVYKAKEVKSIVEFHAAIYSRWGQKLYEWDNVNEGWDGTYHGKAVKDGVYYVQVKARGADGRKFIIKKDVNLMRSYDSSVTDSSTTTN